jgi:hypothetical protein
MAFQLIASFVIGLIGSAEAAAAFVPAVLHLAEMDIAFGILESRADGVFAIGSFGTIYATSGHQGGKLSDCQAEKLFGKDVVDPCLAVRYLFFQSLVQPLGDLAQEYSGFASRIEEGDFLIAPQAFRQEIKHLAYQFWRSKDLVTAKISKAG